MYLILNFDSNEGEESERDKILLEDFCSVDTSTPGLSPPSARLKFAEAEEPFSRQVLQPRWIHIKDFLVRVSYFRRLFKILNTIFDTKIQLIVHSTVS